jgi:hypothetical protein
MREQEQARQVDAAAFEFGQHLRELAGEARDAHALEGRLFRVAEAFDAERVERRTGGFEVQPAAIDFREVGDDVSDGFAFSGARMRQACEEFFVSERYQRGHDRFVARVFSGLLPVQSACFGDAKTIELVSDLERRHAPT